MAKTAEKQEVQQPSLQQGRGEVAVFQPPRLPYHDAIQERFGVDKAGWNALVGAVFPSAKTVDAVAMALAYCKARNLDPFKRPVHIVPMWSSAANDYVETVWPGISELRTTAARTGEYAGCDEIEFGPLIKKEFTGRVAEWKNKQKSYVDKTVEVEFYEYARLTVYRVVKGARCKFVGPKVLWLESYAHVGKSDLPNEMWSKRNVGQLEKCAEAAALRRAFPEEMGNELTAEEMHGQVLHDPIDVTPKKTASDPANEPPAPPADESGPDGAGGQAEGTNASHQQPEAHPAAKGAPAATIPADDGPPAPPEDYREPAQQPRSPAPQKQVSKMTGGEFLDHVAAELGKIKDPHEFGDYWTDKIEPHIDRFDADTKDAVIDTYNEMQAKLGS